MSEKNKYGIWPPVRTVRNERGDIGTAILPGYNLDEWRAQMEDALARLDATFTAEERTAIERERAIIKTKGISALPPLPEDDEREE